MSDNLSDDASLLREVSACTFCAPHLPLGPRPVVQFSATARILIIGQAPGTKVHASGVPWQDDSGDRLREWTGLGPNDFYDPSKVALVPMGFCYPGKSAGGDAPPRPECAPRWHERILDILPPDRLTLLVGSYAQERYLPKDAGKTLVERVRAGGVRNTARETRPAAKAKAEAEAEADADEVAAAIDHNDLSVRTKVDHHPRQAIAIGSGITTQDLKGCVRASGVTYPHRLQPSFLRISSEPRFVQTRTAVKSSTSGKPNPDSSIA